MFPKREATQKGILPSLLSESFSSAFGIGWPVLSLILRTREDRKVVFLQQPIKGTILPLWVVSLIDLSTLWTCGSKKVNSQLQSFSCGSWPSEAVLLICSAPAFLVHFHFGAVFHHCQPAADLVSVHLGSPTFLVWCLFWCKLTCKSSTRNLALVQLS